MQSEFQTLEITKFNCSFFFLSLSLFFRSAQKRVFYEQSRNLSTFKRQLTFSVEGHLSWTVLCPGAAAPPTTIQKTSILILKLCCSSENLFKPVNEKQALKYHAASSFCFLLQTFTMAETFKGLTYRGKKYGLWECKSKIKMSSSTLPSALLII